jgi:hypothetical protein
LLSAFSVNAQINLETLKMIIPRHLTQVYYDKYIKAVAEEEIEVIIFSLNDSKASGYAWMDASNR